MRTGETVRVVSAYGALTKGVDYRVVEEGYDYLAVKARGGIVFLPKNLVQTESDRRREEREARLREEAEEREYDE